MTSLKSRLRAAEGVDRALDADIAKACGWRPHMPRRHQNNPRARYEQCNVNPGTYELWIGNQPCGKEKYVPKLTGSLEAARALVCEVGQTVRYISWHRFNGDPEVVHATVGLTRAESKVGIHKEPAIAVLIALLATLQAKEAQEDE